MSNVDAKVDNEIFRKNNPEIIASNRHLASIHPIRVAYNSSGYKAGTVMALNSVSAEWAAYDGGGSSGLDTARSILFREIDVTEFEATTGNILARALFAGEVYEAKLVGLDNDARTDLGSRSWTDAGGDTVLKF